MYEIEESCTRCLYNRSGVVSIEDVPIIASPGSLPFKSESFSCVCTDNENILAEARRVLVSYGYLWLLDDLAGKATRLCCGNGFIFLGSSPGGLAVGVKK